ncbi:replication initiation factor domain-containing protein [Photobacterium damselae]
MTALAMNKTDMDTRVVACDYLRFSVPLSNFKNLHRAGKSGCRVHESIGFTKMPVPSYKGKNLKGKAFDKALSDFQRETHLALMSRVRQFCKNVLGFYVSWNRGFGTNFYQDSFIISTADGTKAGVVCFGGNNDTVLFDISGSGCQFLFDNDCRKSNDERYLTPFILHWWLTSILEITLLKRIDLCMDFHDDYLTVNSARLAYKDMGFRQSTGKYPKCRDVIERDIDGNILGDTFYVGSRESLVFWRVYNKALQMGSNTNWVRVEAELKDISVDILLNMSGSFSGLCPFSASLESAPPQAIKFSRALKKAALTIEQKTRWLRRQCSGSISALLTHFQGDIGRVLSLMMRQDDIQELVMNESIGRLDIPVGSLDDLFIVATS